MLRVIQNKGGQVSDNNNPASLNGRSRIAAIDLGSNSFHMLITDIDQHGLKPAKALGEKVQLAAGMDKGHLTPALSNPRVCESPGLNSHRHY